MPYGVVVRVFAIVRRAGVDQLGLVTDPLGSGAIPTPSGAAPTPAP